MLRLFLLLLPLLLLPLLPFPASAAVQPGDLIKLVSDGNPDTQHDAAVYFVGADGRRYVFPNAKTYFTWYENFDSVQVISASEMASLPIGGNVTYRPGTRLIKITSDPTVYAVEPGGILRPIVSEGVARSLFGDAWNTVIDDVSDTYFINYLTGSPLAAPVYPTGTVLRRASDNAYYYIEGGAKRRLASEEVRRQLRFQESFVVAVNDDLSAYPDGNDILTAEDALTDTSGRNAVPTNAPPRFTMRSPASSYIAVGTNVTLLELQITSGSDVTLTRLTARIRATTDGNRIAGDADNDDGGLVYKNNAQRNFTQIAFVDSSGVEVFGRQEIALDNSRDQEQTLTFNGSLKVFAGQAKTLYLKARLNILMPNGESYTVTAPISGLTLLDSSGAITTFLPTEDIVGPSLTTLADSLEVGPAPTYGNKTYVRGALNASVSGFSLKATTSAPNVVKSISFQGYIDEGENGGGMLPGADADNGTETRVREMFTGLYLRDGEGALLAGPINADVDGRALFENLNLYIPAGSTKNVVIHANVSATINLEANPNLVSFDIVDAAQDMRVTSVTGDQIPARGLLPNGGREAVAKLTVREKGTMAMKWSGSGGPVVVGSEVQLGTMTFDPEYDDYLLETIAFKNVGSSMNSLGSLRLEYTNSSAVITSVRASFVGDSVVFSGLSVPLPRDVVTSVRLYGDIYSRSGGAVYNETIRVTLNAAGPFVFSSATTGTVFDEFDLNQPEYPLQGNTESSAVVRFSKLTAELDGSTPVGTVYRGAEIETTRFRLTADLAGPVRVKKMSFKIKPNDAGYTGSDNDALELWADANGDFADDDAIVNLRRIIAGESSVLIGEDSMTRLRYTIVSGGVRDDTPSGRDSVAGDYGIVSYEFNDGQEFFIPAGGSVLFSFEIRTSDFAPSASYPLAIQLMSGTDFLWTDIPSGSYTPMTGGEATGVGFETSLSVVQ